MSNKSVKKLISLRVEPEVLQWFQRQRSRGYQTLMHSVLKSFVQQQTEQKIRAAGRAQEIFHRYHAQCFWHYDTGLEINEENIQLVIDGLRKYGGRKGFLLAEELCQ